MCLCGDYCCPSCGPSQGNWQCPLCGIWASEGCVHISEKTGKLKTRKFKKELDEYYKEELPWE